MTASITTSQSAKILVDVDVLNSRQHARQVLGRGPADLDPAQDDLRGPLHAVGDRASSTSTIAAGMPERACAAAMPGAHEPGARARRRVSPAGLDGGSLTPGSRASRFFMKKMPIRLAAIGEPAPPKSRLLLGLQAFLEGHVAALADRLQGDQRGGVLPLGLALDGPLGDGERKVQLVRVQPDRLLRRLPPFLPFPALLQVFDQPAPFLDQAFGRNRVKDEAQRDGLLRPMTSPEQIISMPALMPIKRGNRCVPPSPAAARA